MATSINIPGIGQVEIPDSAAWATEATQQDILSALTGKTGKNAQNKKNEDKASKEATQSLKVMGKSIASVHPGLKILETGFNLLGNALKGATGLAASVFQMSGKFSDLGGVVDFATSQVRSIAGSIPIIGGFITAAAEAAGEVVKLKLSLMDLQKDTFQALTGTGVNLQNNFNNLIKEILDSQISLASFNSSVNQNNDALLIFGGTANNAVMRFAENINQLSDPQSEIGIGLRTLGLGAEEMAQGFTDFLQINRRNSFLQTMDNAGLQKVMAERIKNERIITELTGKTADEQRKAQMSLATDAAFQAALQDIPEGQRDAVVQFLSTLDPAAEQLAKEIIGYGGAVTDASAMMQGTAPDLVKSMKAQLAGLTDGSLDSTQATANFNDTLVEIGPSLQKFVKLGLLPGGENFVRALGDLYLNSLERQNQLAAINQAMGTTETDYATAVKNFKQTYDTQIKQVQELAKGTTSLDELRQKLVDSGLDQQTADLVIASANLDETISKMQAETFDKLNGNMLALSDVVKILTENFQALIDKGLGKSVATPGSAGDMSGEAAHDVELQFGGSLFPGMTALVGEAGPELLSIGNSFGEVMSNKDTQNLFGDMKGMMDSLAVGLQSGDISGTMSKMQEMAPSFESSLQKIGGQVESQVGGSQSLANLEATMTRANTDFQKQSVDYAAQNQVTLEKIEKLLSRILPKALSGNGYF